MKGQLPLLVLVLVAVATGAAGCGDADAGRGTQRYTQGGVSMAPTVKSGQVIMVRSVGGEYRPKRGDVVAFHGGEHWVETKAPLLKRVIAVGGETVACCDPAGKVTVDGKQLVEPYVVDDAPLDLQPSPQSCGSRRFGPVAVPTDSVFVMGDNRAASNDSRCAGPIPATWVFAVMIN